MHPEQRSGVYIPLLYRVIVKMRIAGTPRAAMGKPFIKLEGWIKLEGGSHKANETLQKA
jgi:hypothetical protein